MTLWFLYSDIDLTSKLYMVNWLNEQNEIVPIVLTEAEWAHKPAQIHPDPAP